MFELITGIIVTLVGSIITALIAGACGLVWPFWAILIVWALLVFCGVLVLDGDWFD